MKQRDEVSLDGLALVWGGDAFARACEMESNNFKGEYLGLNHHPGLLVADKLGRTKPLTCLDTYSGLKKTVTIK